MAILCVFHPIQSGMVSFRNQTLRIYPSWISWNGLEYYLGKIEDRLKQILLEKAEELGVEIGQMEVMPDHVHIFVKSKPTYAPHFIVQQFKGISSKKLRYEFPELKSRLPTL
ncbi:MAG: IS200/IS605 family transposase [Turicibacter sp.]